jgi:hypothetical protein
MVDLSIVSGVDRARIDAKARHLFYRIGDGIRVNPELPAAPNPLAG